MKKKKEMILMSVGLLLLAAALALTGYNIYESKRAGQAADAALRGVQDTVLEQKRSSNNTDYYEESPLYEKYPEKEMPLIEIDGHKYIGFLEIPGLMIRLPVMGGHWSYPKLRKAPCLYAGSVYKDDMVIAGHNYQSHFGMIKNLVMGSEVRFIDGEGNEFFYTAEWVDILKPAQTEKLEDAKDWDLTIFTCTYGGRERYALRCVRRAS